ncbi:hypothetical protein BX659_10248 [Orenia metallireducens]|uniref:Uncharacterized protein n=1 Tax=Orenia metallireducens TaxID=1413210 RepID=A0A285F265_9FIRM|nr:hypothetical protein [Orenia metallireducens]PRX34733.1 hypothetical protein BX659_10248 [Orenia metallireducens]SNY05400.1 hypothetical protein SAMN06265827_10148 [Orenia metallireducens]
MANEVEHFLKYGGVKFRYNAPEREIWKFVNSLPPEKRESIAEVSQILAQKGYIDLKPDFSTIDRELLDAQLEENRRI